MKNYKVKLLLILFLSLGTVFFAEAKEKERFYQEKWCISKKGKTEVVMPDRSRCDCLTETNAIEFDFAKKWAESVGQSLLYASYTGKKAGIVLILENKKEERFIKRLKRVIEKNKLNIDIWLVYAEKT